MIPRSPALQIWDDILSSLEMTRTEEPFRIPEHEPDTVCASASVRRRPNRKRFKGLVDEVNPSSVFSTPLSCFEKRKTIVLKMPCESADTLFRAFADWRVEFEEIPERAIGDLWVRVSVVYDAEYNPYLSVRVRSYKVPSTHTILRVEMKATLEETFSSLPAPHNGTLYLVSIKGDPNKRPSVRKERVRTPVKQNVEDADEPAFFPVIDPFCGLPDIFIVRTPEQDLEKRRSARISAKRRAEEEAEYRENCQGLIFNPLPFLPDLPKRRARKSAPRSVEETPDLEIVPDSRQAIFGLPVLWKPR